eukprot:RCo042458
MSSEGSCPILFCAVLDRELGVLLLGDGEGRLLAQTLPPSLSQAPTSNNCTSSGGAAMESAASPPQPPPRRVVGTHSRSVFAMQRVAGLGKDFLLSGSDQSLRVWSYEGLLSATKQPGEGLVAEFRSSASADSSRSQPAVEVNAVAVLGQSGKVGAAQGDGTIAISD